jgi:hypothetical protein
MIGPRRDWDCDTYPSCLGPDLDDDDSFDEHDDDLGHMVHDTRRDVRHQVLVCIKTGRDVRRYLPLCDAATLNSCLTVTGLSPLHTAVKLRNIAAVRLLCLFPGVDVNIRETGTLRTPMHYAMTHGTTEIVDVLFARGANLNYQDYLGRRAIELYTRGLTPGAMDRLQSLLRKHRAGDLQPRGRLLRLARLFPELDTALALARQEHARWSDDRRMWLMCSVGAGLRRLRCGNRVRRTLH